MKKWLLILAAVFALTNFFALSTVALATETEEESFVTKEYAQEFAEAFVEIFNYGASSDDYLIQVAQNYGMWAYSGIEEWRVILKEIGKFTGVKSSRVTKYTNEVIVVEVVAAGTTRDAIVEFTLPESGEPSVTMYSKASLPTLLSKTDLGPNLLIINLGLTLVLVFVVILLLLATLAKAQKREEAESGTVGQASSKTSASATPRGDLTSDCELVAVIAAAIAAAEGRASMESESMETGGLVVRSIRFKRKAGVKRLA
jgi:Na+-transporting methylmalonyl-CoA/oxaloacetate decarboxylase gamma subunit